MGLALSTLDRGGTTGGVAVVTTESATDDDLASLRRLSARFGSVAFVIVEHSAWDPAAPVRPAPPVRSRGLVVRVTADRPFPTAWNAAVGQRVEPRRIRDQDAPGARPLRPVPR
jgi:hypothetical protein